MPKVYKYSILEHILFPPTWLNSQKLKINLNYKTVLITGASFGIGESLTYRLAKTGANLILVARTKEKLISVKEEVERLGGKAHIFPTDLSKPEQIQLLFEYILQFPNGVDIVMRIKG